MSVDGTRKFLKSKVCTYGDCGNEATAMDLCTVHAKGMRQGLYPIPVGSRVRLNPECSVGSCVKRSRNYAGGMCHSHILSGGKEWPKACVAPDCEDGGRLTQGYCGWHYSQLAGYGEVTSKLTLSRDCDFDGCSRHSGKRPNGYCKVHSEQFESGETLTPIVKKSSYAKKVPVVADCAIHDCEREARGKHIVCPRHQSRARSHGISEAELVRILESAKCEICGTPDKIVFDHDHACCSGQSTNCGNCYRGTLCSNCNSALGFAKDSRETLASMIVYLEKFSK